MDTENISDAWSQAEKLWEQKHYSQLQNFLLSHKKDFDPSLFHYNMGVLAQVQQQSGYALYHFKRAEHLGLKGSEIQNALEQVTHQLVVPYYPKNVTEKIYDLSQEVSVDQIALLLSSLLLIFTFIVGHKRKWKKTLLFCFILLTLGSITIYSLFTARYSKAIVVKSSVVREGPSRIFAENSLLPVGPQIMIDDSYEGWFHIAFPKPLTGWIWHDDIAIY